MFFKLPFKKKTVYTGRCYKNMQPWYHLWSASKINLLRPLLLIVYVHDLCNVFKIFEHIIFADDTILFFSHKNIKGLFHTANIFIWFNANKLSLNEDKTKYSLFHKASEKDKSPLNLPWLFINDREIKRITSVKYLEVLIDKQLTSKKHITVIENKVSKNLGLLYRARRVLDSKNKH